MAKRKRERGLRTYSAAQRRVRIAIAKRILFIFHESGNPPELERFALKAFRLLKKEANIEEDPAED